MNLIYCDESCHLELDLSDVMLLGAVTCPDSEKRRVFDAIRSIKVKHNLDSRFEIKWTKVSYSKVNLYLDLINYFWSEPCLSYRGLVATGKHSLDHNYYNNGDYDLWYYKMYYLLLKGTIMRNEKYKIFIDVKDTRGGKRVQQLQQVLCNDQHDFYGEVITSIKQINSKESEILQITDLITGAIGYYHRHLYEKESYNKGKYIIVEELSKHQDLSIKTAPFRTKFDLFIWTPQLGGRIK